MKHPSLIKWPLFALIGLGFVGCAGKQKRICVQNVAYQHGYQAAQKGETVDGASTYQGQICQDYEAYSPSLYRQDFKAGYNKGKKEYCSEFNYKKWGSEDGNLGKEDFPNNYSEAMKICLQDSEYKSMAEKVYKKSFNESFCKVERLENLGIQQAKEFGPLKVPNVKKRCPKSSSKMVAAMRKSYKEQMKTNCTTAFWILKGEEDAVNKRSKGSELTKVQKCPSSKRDALMTQYSKSYNERKALLIEEEKLAQEKKHQQEILDLEKKKQQQAYELEKERLEIEREGLSYPQGRPGGFHSRPHIFVHRGARINARCSVDTVNREARVYVRNESNRYVSLTGRWDISYYNSRGRKIRSNTEHEHLSLSPGEEELFKDRFAPYDAIRCQAALRK